MGPIWSRCNAPQHSHWLKCNHSLYEPYNYSYKLRNTPWRYSKAAWCSNIIITPTGIDRLKDYHLKNEYFIWDWCVNRLIISSHGIDRVLPEYYVLYKFINHLDEHIQYVVLSICSMHWYHILACVSIPLLTILNKEIFYITTMIMIHMRSFSILQ